MDVTKYFEKFGPYQVFLFFFGVCTSTYAAFPTFLHLFLSENYKYRCFIPGCDSNTSAYKTQWLNQTIPHHGDGSLFSSCSMFVNNQTDVCDLHSFNVNVTRKCSKWVFESPHETLERKWNLICDKQWFWDSSESIFMSGLILSNLLLGCLCDRIGRKKPFLVFVTMQMIFSFAKSFSPSFSFFMAMNFFIGVTFMFNNVGYMLIFECVKPNVRAIIGMIFGMTYATGELLLALAAYYLVHWKWILMFVCYLPLIFIPFCFLIPESIEWLATQNNKDRLRIELSRLIRWNKLDVTPEDLESELEQNMSKNGGALDVQFTQKNSFGNPLMLFKTPYLRKCTLAQIVIWFCISLVYFGVSLGSKGVGYNYIVTFSLLAAVEIPGILLGSFALIKWGRKPVQIILLLVCGVVCIVNVFLPTDYSTVQLILAVIGKGCIATQWAVNIVYTVELFPTVVRNVGYGTVSTFARFSAIIASYVPDLANVHPSLPMIIFGSCAFLAAGAMLFLPETANKQLLHDIEDTRDVKKSSPMQVGLSNPSTNNSFASSDEDLLIDS